jgi:hypothetical protein
MRNLPVPLLGTVLLSACVLAALSSAGTRTLPGYVSVGRSGPTTQAGYYYQTFVAQDHHWHVKLVPYFPQAGDLLLFDTHNKPITFCFRVVGSGAPLHCTLIFDRPDGTPALLEAGPDFIQSIFLLEPLPRMRSYQGSVMIRRPRQPVCPEKSAALTKFALEQEGKDYALCRLLRQGTPFRCRTGLRKMCFACTKLDRQRWTCYDLTVAACVVAGTMDPKLCPANAMYPGDMCFDDRYDLSKTYTEPFHWTEHPVPATLIWDPKAKKHRLVTHPELVPHHQ